MIRETHKQTIKHTLLAFVLSFAPLLPVFSQVEAQMSQYMFHHAMFNPASIGENGMANATLQIRNQWMGIPGAPVTSFVSANMPFTLGKGTHAAGVTFLRDQAGAFLNQSANVQYAYKKKLGGGMLSAGASAGFISIGFIADSVKLKYKFQSEYHEKTDNRVPENNETGNGLDLAAGLFYSAPKYYAGISYVHLNNPSFDLGVKTTFHTRGVAYFTGGYDIGFEESKLLLKSSTLLKSDFTTWQAELSSRLEYDKRFWGGLSYRFQDALVVIAGAALPGGITAGVAYDVPTHQTYTLKNGSLELFLSYGFAIETSKNKNRYKSIRIL